MTIFDDPRFRMAIQRAVLEGVVVDGPGTYSVKVPERLVTEIEDLVSPHLKETAE